MPVNSNDPGEFRTHDLRIKSASQAQTPPDEHTPTTGVEGERPQPTLAHSHVVRESVSAKKPAIDFPGSPPFGIGDLPESKPAWLDVYGIAARKKLDAEPEWEWYSLKVIGDAGDTLVEGGIPNANRKGSGRWRGVKGQTVVVTFAEAAAVRAEFERDTGKCATCAGSGKTLKSISVKDGATYRACARCDGSGSSPSTPGGARR